MKIRPHKITSVVSRLELGPEVSYVRRIEAVSGQVLVVRALEEKRVYDQVELTTGRMAHVGKGDVLVGALGRRDALRGFVGRIPEHIRAGDTIQLLNLGGVLGEAVSENRDVGHSLRCEVLGMVTRDGQGVNIADVAITDNDTETRVPPVIVVSGTCMNSGKTVAACEIIAGLTQRGYAVGGAKLTGVAAVRDPLNMQDHGALKVLTFQDCGLPSTAGMEDVAPVAKRILRAVERETGEDLDVVVAEMGDGIIGQYGVDTILRDPEFKSWIRAHVLTANDLVAAWGGVRWMRENDLALDVIAGPATDNQVGMRYVREELGVGASNARTDPQGFVTLVEEAAFTRSKAGEA
ncbi:MAG: hypothetical protein QNJ90_13130 [Planctomycetota bacterium]|nr:hypothetical protein [Planctomycetota bacterium]